MPLSLIWPADASAAVTSGDASATKRQFAVRQFGARGDGRTKDTRSIQSAIDAAGVSGGTVFLSGGTYLSGTLRLRSRVTLHLDGGATLTASADKDDFDPCEKLNYQSYSDEETTDFHYVLLRGQDVEHVSILGSGVIDGNRAKRGGPKPIAFKNCRHVAVRNITIKNSPNYNVSLLGCDYVNIDGVTILNGHCDGIDPDCCRHVRIANCFIESWDDAIALKSSFALGRRRATENVTVTNCVLTTACNALKLGTESSGNFKNVAFRNCAVFSRPELWKRHPISGVSIESVDGGDMDRVTVSNIAMTDVRTPVFIRLGGRGRGQKTPAPGRLQNVSLADIVATGAALASSITGIPGHPARRVTLKNVRITALGGGGADLARRDIPERESRYPEADMFGELPASGLFCRHVEGLTLDGLSLDLEEPDGRPGLVVDEASDLDLRSLRVAPAAGGEPALWLRDVRGCFLHDLRAQEGTKIFARLSGGRTEKIRAKSNDFSEAQEAFRLGEEVRKEALRQEGNLR